MGALVVAVALTAACQGGPSDVPGGGRGGDADTTLTLVAYAVPEPGFREIIPAFNATEAGKGIQITQSYGASGDQSRGVEGGKPADIVNFSVEPDITRLVKAKKVSADWDKDAFGGIPFGSVVTLVVRKGNPKHVKDWDDLLQPGLEVISPSPLSSGSAKWNLLAPYAAKSEGGKNPQAGLDFVSKLVREHVKMRPGSGREATEVFVQGSGDVLISYENEAIFTESLGKPIEHVNVPITFKIENPVAVVSESLHVKKATEFKNFLYTPRRSVSGPRRASGPWTPGWPRNSHPPSRCRRSCGPSRIWADGRASTRNCSTRTTDPSPRSTKRRPDEYRDRKSHLTGQSGGQGATDGRVRHGRGPFA
ncbi:bacterial extracellular solute-binding family protein [Mycobacteroides abscessus MAB_082312_2258]|nr:bacterial extracellular solute-binding family protein [Mycobacteroides abscessus MAB_082312_2258]